MLLLLLQHLVWLHRGWVQWRGGSETSSPQQVVHVLLLLLLLLLHPPQVHAEALALLAQPLRLVGGLGPADVEVLGFGAPDEGRRCDQRG